MRLGKAHKAFVAVVLFALAAILLIVLDFDRSAAGGEIDMSKLGLTEFAQAEITYNGVMHELYWHYEFANQMIRVGRVEDAKAHLKMITFYVNLLPYLSRDKKFFKNPASVKKYDQYATDLLDIVARISRDMGSGSMRQMGNEMEERISSLCFHCHKDLKTPVRKVTSYGKKIDMGAGRVAPKGGRTRIHQ